MGELRVVAACQPNFLPWLGYLEMADRADAFVMLDDAQYVRREWMNRNRVASQSAEGWAWLRVPVRRCARDTPLCEVEIDAGAPWAARACAQLRAAYAEAPAFARWYPRVEALLARPWQRLVDLNLASIRFLAEAFGVADNLVLASSLGVPGRRDERLAAICEAVDADVYLANEGSRPYIQPARFWRRGIGFVFQDYRHPTYSTGERAFVSHLCALDALFWHGEGARSLLRAGRDPAWRARVSTGSAHPPAAEARP